MDIFVSGMGIVSPLGIGLEANFKKLSSESTGILPLQYIDSIHREKVLVGEVKYSDKELLNRLKVENNYIHPSRTWVLALMAAQEALKDAKLGEKEREHYKVGIISSSTVGGLRNTEQAFEGFINGENNVDFIATHSVADATEKLASELNIKDYHTTINTACSSSSNAIILGARLIKNGTLDMVVVGGADSLSKYTINGFNSLLLLDSEVCKPFDEGRKGINLGEGAGFLVLESEKTLRERNVQPKSVLKGYSVTNDAFHLSATSPEGTGIQTAMRNSLKMANLGPEDIDYVNAHGTGTVNNDLTEGKAMKHVFGDQMPAFNSTKSYTGHCLAAAGSINLIYAAMAMENNMVFANLNFKKPIAQHNLSPVSSTMHNKNINHVLSNAIGMGGFCASMILSEC